MAKQKEVPVQFAALAGLREQQGQQDLTILGGMIAEKKLLKWLADCSFDQMPWQMWETTNDFELKHKAPLPKKSEIELMMLERVRFFGEGGDLTLRRDDEQFRWHFIGQKNANVPASNDAPDDFWKEHPKQTFTRFKGQVILWGAWDEINGQERWVENRVGRANLAYPTPLHGQRHVYAHYWEFLDAGQVAFVWMYKLGTGEGDPLLGEEPEKKENQPAKTHHEPKKEAPQPSKAQKSKGIKVGGLSYWFKRVTGGD